MSSFIPVYYHGKLFDWAWVDDEDAELVGRHRWSRACNHAVGTTGTAANTAMHRFILGLEAGDGVVHHINEDGLDNRRANLQHVASKYEHGGLRHPRRDMACGGRADELPTFERLVALDSDAASAASVLRGVTT